MRRKTEKALATAAIVAALFVLPVIEASHQAGWIAASLKARSAMLAWEMLTSVVHAWAGFIAFSALIAALFGDKPDEDNGVHWG